MRLAALMRDPQDQRTSGIVVPGLDRIDAVPVRAVAAHEQEVDRGGMRAPVGIDALVAKSLAVIPAFGMRPEFEPRDDVGSRWCHQDLFLRSRSSPNTSVAFAPFMCSFVATSGSSARRNTLAFFSSPSRTGIVGLFAARSFATSSARVFSAGLSLSTVSANFTFEAVYSWPQ